MSIAFLFVFTLYIFTIIVYVSLPIQWSSPEITAILCLEIFIFQLHLYLCQWMQLNQHSSPVLVGFHIFWLCLHAVNRIQLKLIVPSSERGSCHSWDELAIPEMNSPFLRYTRHSWDELAIPEMNSPFLQRDILAIPSESRIHSVSTIPIIIEQRFAPLHTKGRLERASVLPNSFSPTNPPSRFTERYRNVHRGESLCSSDQAGQGRVDRHAKLPAETSGCVPSPHR